MTGKMKGVVIVKDGIEVGYCRSVSGAAAYLGISDGTVKARLNDGKVKRGYMVRWCTDDDSELPLLQVNGFRKFYSKGYSEDRTITEEERSRYNVLKYEVARARICITPCPFHYAPKPMIGSAKCITCHSFRGRDRETQEVLCTRKI